MLDQILNLVKDQAVSAITNNSQVPEEKKDAAVETTTYAIADGLKSQLTSGNLSNILSMFGSGAGSSNNALSASLQNSVVSALAEKVGLNKTVATTIAATVVPALISLVSKKHNDPGDSFDLGSILSSFTGGGDGKKSGGLMDMIGGLFGGGK